MSLSTEIQINEAQLEEFFVRSCQERLDLKPVSRQIRLQSGILDVFCRQSKGIYYVVELKAEPLQPKHLAQVLGYVCELRAKYPDKIIKPMLIGPSLLESHLTYCLKWFDQFPSSPHEDNPAPSVCDYRLYKFDALTGIEYHGYCKKQRDVETRWFEDAAKRMHDLQLCNRSEAISQTDKNIRFWRCT